MKQPAVVPRLRRMVERTPAEERPESVRYALPWWLAATLFALAAALAGWLLVTAFCLLGWLAVPDVPIGAALVLGTKGWALAHGAAIAVQGTPISVPPLGLSLLIAIISASLARLSGRHSATRADTQTPGEVWPVVRKTALLHGSVYFVVLVAVSAIVAQGEAVSVLVGGVLLGFLPALLGVSWAVGWSPSHLDVVTRLPAWLRALPRALAVGVLIMLVTGAAVLASCLLLYQDRVVEIHESLAVSGPGSWLLLLGQLAWLPNLIIWCIAWASGAGISLGLDTIISPVANEVGLLPAIPVLGAIPASGPGPWTALLWLVFGVIAGGLAAYLVVAAQRNANPETLPLRADLAALMGGLTGLALGGVLILVELIAGGDLGVVRMINLGARMPAFAVIMPTTMGLAGLAGGVLGVMRRPASSNEAPSDAAATPSTER